MRPQHRPHKRLRDLARAFGLRLIGGDTEVSGVTLRTSEVERGDLFVGVAGARTHGAQFAETAHEEGAVALLTDERGAQLAHDAELPTLVAADPRSMLGEISSWLYDTAGAGPRLFGVTGTNGKTSTVHFLEGVLRQLGERTGLSSTAERHIGDLNVVSGLTTPEATELHALLARMKEERVDAVALEISAQALTRHRVDGLVLDVAGFTNLSHDHLDDYGDMETYFAAKAQLFQPDRARRAVVCIDNPWSERLIASAGIPVTTITSRADVLADWHVRVTAEHADGVEFTVTGPGGISISTGIPVVGSHMAANAGLAIAMVAEGGYDPAAIDVALAGGDIDVYLPGRTERVSGDRGPAVFVDFGHSADAFEATLSAVRRVTPGRVIMVFGADGDRDASKRPDMARTAVAGSDLLVVTDHHPRFEEPAGIRATLVRAAREAEPDHEVIEVADPKRAIREAVSRAREGDAILWAGPGHQNYRDIEGTHVVYSARSEARAALREAGWEPR